MKISSQEPCLILVDEKDREVGIEDKLVAHLGGGQLHRAFSVFILDDMGRVLLQRRARSKYHCPGLWSNSCCSHPQPGMTVLDSARLRLSFELGFSAPLTRLGTVQYKLGLGNGMTEWELNHLWLGRYNGPVVPNPEEVEACKLISLSELKDDIGKRAEVYTPWLAEILPVLDEHLGPLSEYTGSEVGAYCKIY